MTPRHRDLFASDPDSLASVAEAEWQWSVWNGRDWLCGLWVWPEPQRHRGWVLGAFSPAARESRSAIWGRDLLRVWRILLRDGPYSELRTWIDPNDDVAIRFAVYFGLAYDCGPATGIGPDGRDYALHLWRR